MKKQSKSFNDCSVKQSLPGLKPISFVALITPALRLELKSEDFYGRALALFGQVILKRFIQTFSFLLLSIQAFSQTETFDIASYTPPKDWKKDAKEGVMNYTNVNTTTGGFCVINIYASTASTGDAKKDFNKGWNDLIVTPFKAEANPKTETQTTDDGWKVISAAAPIKLDGADVIVMLSVVSGFGKTMSIRASLNDQSYTADIDALFETMELSKTKTAIVNNNITTPVPTSTTATGKSDSYRIGMMMYTPLAGWSHQVFSDGVVFKPLDLPAGEHLAIQIMQPINFAGSLEQALAKSFDEAAVMYNGTTMNYAGTGKKYKQTNAKRSFNRWEYMMADGGIRIGAGDYPPEYGLTMFVVKINNRFERVAVLRSRTINRSCSMSAFYADERQQYRTAIDNFLLSLQFTDGEEPLLKRGTTNGGGLIGVWQGISMQTSATAGIRYNVYTPIFLSNGQAYFGPKFPSAGLEDLDTRIPAELYQRDWGTYTFSGGKGILKMPYADIPMRMEGKTLIITANQTDHRFYQLPPVDGARFNGRYVMSEAYGKIPSIDFTADGKFTDNGAIRVLYHEYVDCINPALKPGSGTYEVKDYTITFNYTDGRKIKIAFLGTEYDIKNQSPSVLRMSANEDPMKRQ